MDISVEEFKKIAYGILEYFKYICEKYDIFYSLSFGTVLGAVRHNGFIPWDDDIDVCVFREDYSRLINAFQSENSAQYKLISTEVDENYSLPHMKIIDTSTVLFQHNRTNNYPLGIWIDVFALDNVPDDVMVRDRYIKKLERFQSIWSMLEYVPQKSTVNVRGLAKKIFRFMIKLTPYGSSKIWARKLEVLARKYQFSNTDSVGVLSFFPYSRKKSIFRTDFLINTMPHKFEKETFPIPKDYDYYLSQIYGDYMTLPPVEKRVTHHNFTVSYKTNCE